MVTPSSSADNPAISDADILDALTPDFDGAVTAITIGLNWTFAAVSTPFGAGVGLAQTPSKAASNCVPLKDAGQRTGSPIARGRRWAAFENPIERALGVAVLNAAWHARFAAEHRGRAEALDGLALAARRADRPGARSVVVGRFPGLSEKLPGAKVIERHPGPKDYPESAAPDLVPQADILVITAATLMNGSLAGLLNLRRHDACTVLVGPGAPLSPRLFALGLDALSGFDVTDVEKARAVVQEAGAVAALRGAGTRVTLQAGSE